MEPNAEVGCRDCDLAFVSCLEDCDTIVAQHEKLREVLKKVRVVEGEGWARFRFPFILFCLFFRLTP
jgi:hypothetical protein